MYYFYQPRYYMVPSYAPVSPSPPVNQYLMHQSKLPSTNSSHLRQLAQQNVVPEDTSNKKQPLNENIYPPVDPELMHQSAIQTNKLMNEASLVLDKLASSKEFNAKIMDAAQRSDNEEVERLIQSIGITAHVDVSYNPDGIRLEFKSKVQEKECCKLLIALRWR